MALNGEGAAFSSPIGRKSDSASRDQTPSTAFTSFSPEEARLRSEGRIGPLNQAKTNVATVEDVTESGDHDPFKFTPTAQEFKPSRPFGAPDVSKAHTGFGGHANLGPEFAALAASFERTSLAGAGGQMGDFAANTKQAIPLQPIVPVHTMPGVSHAQNPIYPNVKLPGNTKNFACDGNTSSGGPKLATAGVRLGSRLQNPNKAQYPRFLALTNDLSGAFSTDPPYITRTLYLDIPNGLQNAAAATVFIGEHMSPEIVDDVDMEDFASHGFVILSFHDVRNAVIAAERAKDVIPGVRTAFLNGTGKYFRNPLCEVFDEESKASGIPLFEGQIAISVSSVNATVQECSPYNLEAFAMGTVAQCGIRNSECVRLSSTGITMRIELFDMRLTYGEVFKLDKSRHGHFYITICRYDTWKRDSENISQPTQISRVSPVWQPRRSPFDYDQSAGRTMRGHSYQSGHNQVNLDRIGNGLDVRTTIMLRNIPNRVTHSMLKTMLDQTSLGHYDFMYLRIDFANNCNVGYAFINFADPIHIVGFATARAGRRWNAFNSDKVAEISYATIQGKDCLVSKFRNSSVMLEQPDYRPKLYRTGNGPDAGQEEEFPKPDNYMKMRRSCENAAHVGLFAPRLGQHFRAEQRHRQSQYDRGTMAAQAEAAATGYRDLCCSCGQYHLDGTCAGPSNFRRFA